MTVGENTFVYSNMASQKFCETESYCKNGFDEHEHKHFLMMTAWIRYNTHISGSSPFSMGMGIFKNNAVPNEIKISINIIRLLVRYESKMYYDKLHIYQNNSLIFLK